MHVAYVLAVAAADGTFSAMTAYTTSQPWPGTLPHGVLAFGAEAAAARGQPRPFVLDLRRLAYVPINASWFPRLPEPGAGVLGRAPKSLRNKLNAVAAELATRRPELLDRLGPLWRARAP